jgi:TRAP-type uncharacterized transport system substrate-binding protein
MVASQLAEEAVVTNRQNLVELRGVHPALGDLDAEDMTDGGLPTPLHPGALR